jgi:hypothetical protein
MMMVVVVVVVAMNTAVVMNGPCGENHRYWRMYLSSKQMKLVSAYAVLILPNKEIFS